MGQPIKIVDLAERLIRLSGLEPGRDVDIVFTGIRPGERLNEILFAREEGSSDIGIDGVVAAKPVCPSIEAVRGWIEKLKSDLDAGERAAIYGVLREAVPNFRGVAQFPAKQ
jgi:O-antigen biosynthesis protein WbqV